MKMIEEHIFQISTTRERIEQWRGRCRRTVYEDVHTAFDGCDGSVRINGAGGPIMQ
jgi:hypothetical protein